MFPASAISAAGGTVLERQEVVLNVLPDAASVRSRFVRYCRSIVCSPLPTKHCGSFLLTVL